MIRYTQYYLKFLGNFGNEIGYWAEIRQKWEALGSLPKTDFLTGRASKTTRAIEEWQ